MTYLDKMNWMLSIVFENEGARMTETKAKTSYLKPLSKLKVVRDLYCSQEMTNEIITYFEDHYPEKLLALLVEEKVIRISLFYNGLDDYILAPLIQEISKVIDIPKTFLGEIDLVHEISRRLRKAYNLPEVKLQGNPLARAETGPFPNMPHFPVIESTRQKGLSQNIVDQVLTESYAQRPDLWFALAESVRTNMRISTLDAEFDKHIKKIAEPYEIPELWKKTSGFSMEAMMRIRDMCQISEYEIRKLCEPHNV